MGLYHSPRIVTDGLVLCLDAANTKGYDKFENLFTYSGFPQSSNTAFPTGWNGWNPATCLKSQTLSPNEVDYGVFHGAINQNGGGIRKDLTGLSANTTYTISFWGKRITESELTYFTNNNGRGTTTGTTDGAQNVAWFVATKCVVNMANLNGTGASGGQVFTLSETWTKFSTQLTTDSAGSIRIIISNNVSDVGTGNEDGGGTWMIWGAQLEIGSSVTEYYPTTSTTKTRGTTWTDLSIGGGNNGTLVNGVGYSNGTLSFDGINDYVDMALSSTLQFGTSDFTLEYWLYPISKVSPYPSIFTNYSGWGPGAIFLGLDHQTYLNKYSFWINGQGAGSSTTTNITYNKWEHLIACRDGGICKLYLNGVQDGTTIDGSGITLNGRNSSLVRIGAIQSETSVYNGRIGSMKVYNRALTALEVQQNFNAQRGRFGI